MALKLATEAEQRVYACAELFSEAVVMPSGFTLFGGLDCHNGWAYSGASTRTMIKPLDSAIALTFLKGEHGLSLVTDVHAEGPNASAPGASSIAVLAREGSEVVLRRCTLVANHGAAGWPGEPGDEHNMPGGAGTSGTPGADACSADMIQGGAQVKTSCGGLTSIGAQGGNGGPTSGTAGADGQPSPSPNPLGFGVGGKGESGGAGCMVGEAGADGANGKDALGAHGPAHISDSGYEADAAGDGEDGLPGQGGGGGGGRRAGALFCGVSPKGGAAGGSGGSGGCGGKGGRGGGAGGSSIALVSLAQSLTLTDCHLTAGDAGDGGNGGVNQIGGPPGIAGEGGTGKNGSGFGCAGGQGGKGGNGGNGGGGLGGSSIAFAHIALTYDLTAVNLVVGKRGKGGYGGNPNLMGSAGEDGIAQPLAALLQ
ncbi:MAG: PGRS family protein [Byssovorax sp.]